MAGIKLNMSYVQEPSVVGNPSAQSASEASTTPTTPPFQAGCVRILQSKKLKNKNRNYINIKTITKGGMVGEPYGSPL